VTDAFQITLPLLNQLNAGVASNPLAVPEDMEGFRATSAPAAGDSTKIGGT